MKQKNRAPKPDKNYPLYFYIVLYSLPFLFFALLEIGLRIFGYGHDIQQWIPVSKDFPNRITLNPEIAKRYFSNIKEVPAPWVDGFEKAKSSNTFRVFVFGESSTAGFPYDLNASFPKEIKRRLDILYPESNNEVINLAMTAINSYAFADLIDGVIEKKPDLVIFYAGHNEYYGALGVGSNESLGGQFWIVRFILKLEQFKTVQLIKSMMASVFSVINSQQSDDSGTLMKRMVGEQYIPLHSETYQNGIRQFRENMEIVLTKLMDNKIPVLLGTVTSNLRDQRPFISESVDSLPKADSIYVLAKKQYEANDYEKAKLNFSRSKELDLLRFRAPAEINSTIRKLSANYKTAFVDIDSAFSSISEHGIVGDNLMTDHLHPNLSGYRFLGFTFFNTMIENNYLPKNKRLDYSYDDFRQMSRNVYPLTSLDSVIAEIKIKRLKNSWPFVDKQIITADPLDSIIPANIVEKYALDVIRKKTTWEEAHAALGQYYIEKKDYFRFTREFNALIEFAPFNDSPYEFIANGLVTAGLFDQAFPFLMKLEKINSSAFSAKWIGITYLIHQDYENAVKYLMKSSSYNPNDPQVLYNLSGAYFSKKEYEKALESIDNCLQINPSFNEGSEFRKTIMTALTKQGKSN